MNWKEKLKWKILIILIALAGILIVWYAGEAGAKNGDAKTNILRECVIRENEWASAQAQESAEPPEEVQEQEEAAPAPQAEAEQASADPLKIRVLLMNNGYKSYYHTEISIQLQGDYQLLGAQESAISDGETLKLNPDSPELTQGSVTLQPHQAENRAVLLSLNRGQGNPAYRGSLTIYKDEQGLRIVNELSLEEYLCAVVPSEMPASYPKEALKAQAVCARTYAYVQLQSSKLESLGAQVDDSVAFQVYQNSGEAEDSTQAVMETQGKILLNNQAPITAYYFSTSHGKTSTDEVWEASVPSSYLKSVECTYDANEPWYQWSLALSKEQVLQNIQKLFPEVKTLEGLEIREKGEGDAVLSFVLHTDQGETSIHSEYEIRSILAPQGAAITRQDGSVVKGGALLPSAYFSLEEQRDENQTITGWRIVGGGYGHGVGMSQNGAKGMADMGKTYEEILSYFYKDVEIGDIGNVVNEG